jgi:drug/metabolite transporter (DMT)-like permease
MLGPDASSPASFRSRAPTAESRTLSGGQLLLIIAALAFSLTGFFTREAPVNLWAMVFWRNLFGGAALLPFILASPGEGLWRATANLGVWGWAMIAAGTLGTIFYLGAFAHTSVANVSIIYASAPLMTAFAAFLWLGERPARKTLVAAVLALFGVAITVSGSTGGAILGDSLALAMTIAFSLMTVFARRHARLPALMTSCLSSFVAALAAAPLSWAAGASLAISWSEMGWLAAFGIVAMAIALPCYFLGAARVPAGQTMLISALEMPLAPLWVWLAFAERPSFASFIGGGVVAVAVLWQLSSIP